MKDLLRSYQGKNFEEMNFAVLEKSFLSSYEKMVRLRSDEVFVKCYSAAGSRTEKTFVQFDSDVKSVSVRLFNLYNSYSILATSAGNTYEHLVYIVAILRLGFIFCPLNPTDSPSARHKKISQLGVGAFVLPDLSIPPTNEFDEPEPKLKVRDPHKPFIYVFTSGSTGHSKIVEQTEAGVLCNIEALIKHHGFINQRLRIATPLPLFHVNALEFSFLTSLLSGQTLILYEKFDMMQVFRSLQEDEVEILSVVPHLLFAISQQMSKFKNLRLEHFRYFISAAAPLSLKILKEFSQSGFKILQGYGLSEAVNFSLLTPTSLTPAAILELAMRFQRPTAGVVLWGNEVEILDDGFKKCTEQQIGQIAIRGPNIMIGYKDSVAENPFQENFLLTGDRGFWFYDTKSAQKFIFVSGRSKDTAKRFGSTISLVELDEALMLVLPTTINAISFCFENDRAGEEIGLALQGIPSQFDVNKLYFQLKNELPAEMLAKVFLLTDDKIRTDSGKALRWIFKVPAQEFLQQQDQNCEYYLLDRRVTNE
jgi:acyl-CoA synthetase (AMP-forming)/AMP-acid ligase II